MKKITLLIVTLLLSFVGFSQGLPLEGFENTTGPDLATPTTPSDWTLGTGTWAVFDNGVGLTRAWNINTTNVYAGVNSAFMDREFLGQGNTAEDYLATPLITVPANGQLRFFTKSTLAGDTGTLYQIKVAPSSATQINPNAYTLIQQWTETTLSTVYNVYEEKVVDLTLYAGQQIYVAFVMTHTQTGPGLSGDRWLIDDAKIVERCFDPTSPTANNITQTSAELSWTNPSGSTSWEIEVIPAAGTPTGTGIIYSGALPYLATTTATGAPLTPTTSYVYYVRSVCSNSLSNWVGPTPFSTSSPGLSCASPIVITSSTYSTTDTTANYGDTTDVAQPAACAGTATNYMTGNDVFYSFTPTTTGTISITMTPNANWSGIFVYQGCANVGVTCVAGVANTGGGVRSIPSLSVTAGLPYIIVISTNAAPQTVGYTLVIQPVNCPQPNNLTASTVTQNSAQLSWGNPGSATSWEVAVQPAGSAIPAGSGVQTNINTNYPVGSLTPDTAYQYWVRADCGNGTFSAWAGPFLFTTQAIPPACGGTFTDPGGATANYANNLDNTITICPINVGDAVTVTFTSFNTQATSDGLYIYNGDTTAAPLIASSNPAGTVPGGLAGSYWGTTNPGSFTSSSSTGCLTFRFRSNGTVNAAGWVANVTCALAPTCPQPISLVTSTVTSNSVNLAWTETGTATQWEVLALPCGSPQPTASSTGFVAAPTNPFVLTGINADTCYDIYVRSVCVVGTNISNWTGPRSITTLQTPPACGGTFTDPGGASANYANNANVTTIICPTNANDQVTVTFTSFATENNFDFLRVYDGNNTTTLLASYTGNAIPASITSSAGNGCLTFVFTSDGSVPGAGFIANITCAPAPTCPKPTALTTSSVTSTSVVLNWTNNSTATSFQVLALPCGSPLPTATTTGFVTVNSNPPYTYTGLTADTCYNFYVRAVCSATDISAWSTSATATTLQTPPACGGIFTDLGGATANYPNGADSTVIICPTNPNDIVTVTFTSFNTEANWDGLYVFDGNSIAAPLIPSANPGGNVPGNVPGSYWGTAIPGPFTSSSIDGCLTFRFRSDGSVNNPGWIANVTCNPEPTCPKPVLLTATNVTQSSATLGWTEAGTATAWEIYVVPVGSPAPIATTLGIATTNPYSITNLPPGTAYTFYVRAICSSTDISEWSAPFTFGTLPLNDECATATFAIVNQNLNCVQTTPGTITGATGSLPTTTCPGAANDDVWFTFTATSVTHFISFNNVAPANTILNYAVFQGTSCGALTEVGCNSGANLIPGNTYYIRVYSTSTLPQFANFNLCIGTLPCTEAPAFCTGQTVTYANSTNIPSLGTIGCLFTSPNPAFFFLQVNQAGPLSYLISQVDNGGVPRDVDYVAWGPFTDLSSACTSVPANPLAGQLPALTPAQGCNGNLHACSYSAAPTEIMCIPNAQLCQVYVVMITNFSNQAGSVTFTQTNSGGGTTECFPINTFNYPLNSYCQDGVDPTPVLANGASAGTYTSTPGLVINSATGTIDLSASTPGAYIVTSTTLTSTNGVCTNIPTITTSRTVIITAPANATFSYSATQYCNSITAQQNANIVGTTGGTYSSTPSGLFIYANNGSIIPSASAPGDYTVTYTVAATGGCAAFTTTSLVSIIASPVIPQPANVVACNSYTLPNLSEGNYYSQPNGQGTQYPSGTVFTSSQVNVYIYAQNALCSNEKSFSITINSVPDPVVVVTSQPTCLNPTGAIQVTSPTDGVVLPSNLFISEVTDADTGSLTYVELYNATGASVNLANYKLKTYNNGNATVSTGCDNILSGTLANNSTYVIKLSSSANQSGIVPNISFTTCGAVNIDDNIRLTTLSDVEVDVWGRTDGVVFTPAGQPGYAYRRNVSASVPSTTFNPTDWTTVDPEVYTNVGSYTYVNSNYQYNVDGGTYQASTIFTGLTPGSHVVTVKNLTTNCISNPVSITINAVPLSSSVTTFSYVTPVCQVATVNPVPNTSASGFTTGGTFSSTTGLTINSATGEINLALSLPGSYVVTYSVLENLALCQAAGSSTATIDLIIPATPVTTFSYFTPVCQLNTVNPLPDTSTSGFASGGVYSSTPGLSINSSTGEIDLATSTAGTYVVTYTILPNVTNCQLIGSSTSNIEILAATIPVTSFSYTTPVCSNASSNPLPTTASGFTTGGIYSSTTGLTINPTTGVINLATSIAGTYVVTYTISQSLSPCLASGSSTASITINPVITPNTSFSYDSPACADGANESPILSSGFTSGGTYSSTTGLSIDASTGIVNVVNSTPGTYTITYSVASNSSICQVAASGTAVLIIENDVLTSISGDCVGSNFVLTSSPLNSSYNPSTVTYTWFFGTTSLGNNQTQTVTQPGSYSVRVSSNGCIGIANFVVDAVSCTIQKGISPNNDQLNDSFDLTGLNVRMLSIYNRYGSKVYSRSNYVNEWVGQSDKNDELPDGTYYYVIERDNADAKSGWVYINRENK